MISVKNLSREFKVPQRGKSFLGYIFNRQYKIIEAVKDVSFQIERGELIGFIGPNGAGKSTTIKMMSGILMPSGGEIKVMGMVPCEMRRKLASEIGVLFGHRSQLWWDLPVRDSYFLLKKIYKIPEKDFQKNLSMLTEVIGINEFIDQPVRQLSLGQRMRADIGASLLHNPKILFLDEPTIGLDVVTKKQIRELIKALQIQNKTTVVLTTHDMKDIEEICERIIMIDKGVIMLDQPINQLKRDYQVEGSLIVDFEKEPDSINIKGVCIKKKEGIRWTLGYNLNEIATGQIVSQLARDYNLINISIREPEIEDIVRNIYLSN